jgi:hypothetical protein
MAVAKESNLCNDLFHPQLLGTKRLRKSQNKNNRRKLGSTEAEAVTVGNVIPSDIAFVDILLEQREIISISDCTTTSLFDVSSIRRSQECDNLLSITFTHETVFFIETTSSCDGTEIWGQSSSCVLSNDQLKVKISNKCKKDVGSVRNARETKVFSLVKLVNDSAKARENEMMKHKTQCS